MQNSEFTYSKKDIQNNSPEYRHAKLALSCAMLKRLDSLDLEQMEPRDRQLLIERLQRYLNSDRLEEGVKNGLQSFGLYNEGI